MSIVAAGVHHAGHGGAVLEVVRLLDGQRIHIGAQCHDWPARPDVRNDPRLADACANCPAKLAQTRARIWEMPISYSGRTYAEGKKIGWKDGIAAFWHIFKFNFLGSRAPLYTPALALPDAAVHERVASGAPSGVSR